MCVTFGVAGLERSKVMAYHASWMRQHIELKEDVYVQSIFLSNTSTKKMLSLSHYHKSWILNTFQILCFFFKLFSMCNTTVSPHPPRGCEHMCRRHRPISASFVSIWACWLEDDAQCFLRSSHWPPINLRQNKIWSLDDSLPLVSDAALRERRGWQSLGK